MSKKFVEWSSDLSVGIQEIDEQHQVLINLINRLYDEAIVRHAEEAVVIGILAELVDYTIVHFAVEESLFRIFHYPATEVHSKHHEELKQRVLEIQKRVVDGHEKADNELLLFLSNWLKNHIQREDKQYAPFLLKHGVKASWEKEKSHSWFGRLIGSK
jgi:hemerythrin